MGLLDSLKSTFTSTGEASVPPAASFATREGVIYAPVNGVLVNFGTMLVAEGAVQSGDRLAIIEAGVVAPSKDDQLVAEGRIWTIVDFATVSPGGTAIIYKLQVRS